ncbi:uncharacterized protein ACN427_005875 isoform 1-T2 [Glossina fuscipes fuscipes]
MSLYFPDVPMSQLGTYFMDMSADVFSALSVDSSNESMHSERSSQGSRLATPNIIISDVQMDAQWAVGTALVGDIRNKLAHSSLISVKSVKFSSCTVDISGSASGLLPSAFVKKGDGITHEGDYKVVPSPVESSPAFIGFLLFFPVLFQTLVFKRLRVVV